MQSVPRRLRLASQRSGSTSGCTCAGLTFAQVIVGTTGDQNDFSGSLVQAQDGAHPIQVITSLPCIDQPEGTQACDHIEESVMPRNERGGIDRRPCVASGSLSIEARISGGQRSTSVCPSAGT